MDAKARNREAAKKYYHSHKEEASARAKKWRENNQDYRREYQSTKKRERKEEAIKYLGGVCKNCGGEFHPSIFEFHHTVPTTKDRDPSKVLNLSWKRVVAELDKCVLLCANCHRYEHNKWEQHGTKTVS